MQICTHAGTGTTGARSTDITRFKEHRRHLRDHLHQIRQTSRPLYVTTNGETALESIADELGLKLDR